MFVRLLGCADKCGSPSYHALRDLSAHPGCAIISRMPDRQSRGEVITKHQGKRIGVKVLQSHMAMFEAM
jgi:hypothetical protein